MRNIVAIIAASVASIASAQLINGNFEQPALGFRTVQPGQTWGNWTCSGPSDIEYVKAEFNPGLFNLPLSAYEGEYWIDLCGVGAPSGIYQDVQNLSAGSFYRVEFAKSGNVWGQDFNFAMDVLWNNQVVASFSSIHGGFDGANMNWQLRSVDVLAATGINRLEFRATTGLNARGAAIDDVTLNLIPAPGSALALVLGGLAAARRRR